MSETDDTQGLTNHPDLVEIVRQRCIEAAREAYVDAGVRGLCLDGRWECVIAAVRNLDLRSIGGEPEREADA